MAVGRLSCNFCGIEILSMCFLFMPFSQVQDFLRWTIWVNRALEMPISRSIGKTVLHITSAFLMCTTLILLIHIFRNITRNTRKYIEQTPSQFLCMQASGWLKTFSDRYIWKDTQRFIVRTFMVWLRQSIKHNVVKKKDVYALLVG